MAFVAIILLLVAVGSVMVRPRQLPSWTIPLACALVAVVLDVSSINAARHALVPLAGPIAFLLAAVPLAIALDRLGFFAELAERLIATGRGSGALWILAAVVTTVLNLDAAVVLLTPLYVQIARHTNRDPLTLAFQPVLLACLASSALPVSNLTNLIAASTTSADTTDFLAHLAVPSLVATTVGWWRYRRVLDPDRAVAPLPRHLHTERERHPSHPRALRIGGIILGITLLGFVGGAAVGVEPWIVALAADLALVAILRRSPRRDIPFGTAVVVASLGVLAASAVVHLPIERLVDGAGTTALARTIAATAVAANLVNNLPALLVALPAIDPGVTPALWAVLIGVNVGPVVLVTGSLASLLWLDALHRLDVAVRPRDFTAVGVRVGLPAAVAGAVSFLMLNAIA